MSADSYGLKISHYICYFFIPVSILLYSRNIYTIFTKDVRVRAPNVPEIVKAILYVLTVSVVMFWCATYTAGDILGTNPQVVCYLYGLLLLRQINFMQLHLVTTDPLHLWRRMSVLSIFLIVGVYTFGGTLGLGSTHVTLIYLGLVVFNMALCWHLIYYAMTELSEILDIDIFSIQRQLHRYKALGLDR